MLLGIATKSSSPKYIENAIEQAIDSLHYLISDTKFIVRKVSVTNETTAEKMCSALLADSDKSGVNGTNKPSNTFKKDHEQNSKLTFLIDASGIQVPFLANGSTSNYNGQASFDFSHRFGVPGVTIVSSSWTKNVQIPSSDREWHLTVKTVSHVITSAMIKDLILEYGMRKVAILFDQSYCK